MKKVAAIVGGGVIGAGWLARFLLNGWDVKVFDPDPEAKRKVEEVLSNGQYIQGPEIKELETSLSTYTNSPLSFLLSPGCL